MPRTPRAIGTTIERAGFTARTGAGAAGTAFRGATIVGADEDAARFSSIRNWPVTSAKRTRSRSHNLDSITDCPLTAVPLVELRSLRKNVPSLRVILAWNSETE